MDKLKLAALQAKANTIKGTNQPSHNFLKELYSISAKYSWRLEEEEASIFLLMLKVIEEMRTAKHIKIEISNYLSNTFRNLVMSEIPKDLKLDIIKASSKENLIEVLGQTPSINFNLREITDIDILDDILGTELSSEETKCLEIERYSSVFLSRLGLNIVSDSILATYLTRKYGKDFSKRSISYVLKRDLSEDAYKQAYNTKNIEELLLTADLIKESKNANS